MKRIKWLILIGIVLIVTVSYLANVTDLFPAWTGFGAFSKPADLERGKTLWDWFELLLVPALLALGVWWLNLTQKQLEETRVEEQRKLEASRAEEHRKLEQELADRRERQEALQAYLDRMSSFILNTDLDDSASRKKLGMLARAHTMTVLQRLEDDGKARGRILRFLYESRLIKRDNPIMLLWGVDFEGTELPEGTILVDANLSGAILNKSRLPGVYLQNSILAGTQLKQADLSSAQLQGSKLIGAPPDDEQLQTVLDLVAKQMRGMKYIQNGIPANLEKANLSKADLTDAVLIDEHLQKAITDSHTIRPKVIGQSIELFQPTQANQDGGPT